MSKNYCGDIVLTVRYRYRVDVSFEKLGKDNRPTKEQLLQAFQDDEVNDVLDTEELELLTIEKVGKNYSDEEDEEE